MNEFYFDPAATHTLNRNLNNDDGDKPFISMRVDGVLVDFEGFVDAGTRLYSWADNKIRGKATEDQAIGTNQEVNFLWETGVAAKRNFTMNRCSFEGDECYEVKTVPVINNMSANTSFLSGGLELTVYGNGFQDGYINATADGVPCHVTYQEQSYFTCET